MSVSPSDIGGDKRHSVVARMRALGDWLWSYQGSFWTLCALALTLSVWVVPFQVTGQPNTTVDAIAWGWIPLKVLYVLIAVSTLVCTAQRLVRDARRVRLGARLDESPDSEIPLRAAADLSSFASRLEKKGYRVEVHGESRFRATRHALSPLGGSVFHVALLVLCLAIVLQHALGQSAAFRVIEGQSFAEATAGQPRWVVSAVTGLTLSSVRPEYFEDVLLFTKLQALLETAGGSTQTMSLAGPRWVDPFTHLSIQDYGFAPRIRVIDSSGDTVDKATVGLNVFPPGAEDSVEIGPSSLRVSMVVYPDYGRVEGRDVSLTYNVRDPRYKITAESQSSGVVARGLVRNGEPLRAGGESLVVEGLSRYGTFRLSRSPAPPLILLSGVLMLVGLCARLLFPRHDVVAWSTDDGVVVDGWLDGQGRDAGRALAVRLGDGL